jgi:putative SOS response-associated peptidase YedK
MSSGQWAMLDPLVGWIPRGPNGRRRPGRDPNVGIELAKCTTITTQPNELVAPIDNRMPVILLPEDEDHWLDPDMSEPDEITSLLRLYPADLMVASRA